MNALTPEIKADIARMASLIPDAEACGLIMSSSDGLVASACRNISPRPESSFAIPHSILRWAMGSGSLEAIWHSHCPPSEPGLSELDKLVAEKLRVPCVAYDIERGQFHVHSPCGYEVPYLGRPFVPGVFDCWTLVMDWHWRELNIKLEDISHEVRNVGGAALARLLARTDASSSGELLKALKDRGFAERPIQGGLAGDVLLMSSDNIQSPLHMAICLGKDRMLHHPEDGESLEEFISPYWRGIVKGCVRHVLA